MTIVVTKAPNISLFKDIRNILVLKNDQILPISLKTSLFPPEINNLKIEVHYSLSHVASISS